MRPQAGRTQLVAGQQTLRRPQRSVRVEDPVGQPLEEVSFVGLDAQVMQLDLSLRPRQDRRAFERGRLAVFVGQVEDLLSRLGDDRGEDRVRGSAGRERDPAPEAEDRIQHRADRVREWMSVDHGHR